MFPYKESWEGLQINAANHYHYSQPIRDRYISLTQFTTNQRPLCITGTIHSQSEIVMYHWHYSQPIRDRYDSLALLGQQDGWLPRLGDNIKECHVLHVNSKCTHRQMTILWLTKDRPGLSSERAPHTDKARHFRPKHLKRKQYLVKRPQSGSTPRHTDWLTVSCKVILTACTIITLPDSWNGNWLRIFFFYFFFRIRPSYLLPIITSLGARIP
jgi:hypothetical protein